MCRGILALALYLFVANAGAQSKELYAIQPEEQRFFEDFQQAVRTKDKTWVSEHVSYPLVVRNHSRRDTVRSAAEFVLKYDEFISARVSKAVTETDPKQLAKNWSGIRVGHGEVWITAVRPRGKTAKPVQCFITAINP